MEEPLQVTYVAIKGVLVSTVTVPLAILTVILMFAVTTTRSISKPIQIVLVNILAGNVLTSLGLIVDFGTSLSLFMNNLKESNNIPILLYQFLELTGGAARFAFTSLLAIIVYIIVKKGISKINIWLEVMICFPIWVMVLGINSSIASGVIFHTNTTSTDALFPKKVGIASYIFGLMYNIIFVLGSITISSSVLMVTLLHIKRNSISGDNYSLRIMIKFSLYLLTDTILLLIGKATPVAITLFTSTSDHTLQVSLSYIITILYTLSLIPTPVLLIIYFKRLRDKIKGLKKRLVQKRHVYHLQTT